jgi:hypothetical protein
MGKTFVTADMNEFLVPNPINSVSNDQHARRQSKQPKNTLSKPTQDSPNDALWPVISFDDHQYSITQPFSAFSHQ